MPAKLTIEQVRDFIKTNDTENCCTLLSNEYVNSTTPLEFRCNICGEEFQRDWTHIKRGRFKCSKCANATSPRSNRASIEDVKEYLANNDINHECTLLSTEYVNNNTPLSFICNICGKPFERDFNHVKRGRFRCEKCGELAGAKTLKYTKEQVEKDIFNKRGYKILGEYIDAAHPVLVECSKGHQFDLTYSNFLVGHSGCKQCANEALRGENHWNYQGGGHQEIMAYLRDRIKPWKRKILDTSVCDITGENTNLVIHHLYNFSKLVYQASETTGIPLFNRISDYYDSEYDLQVLADEVIRLNAINPYVVLSSELHQQFHKEYGLFNNTPEQYAEFKAKVLGGTSS